MTSEPQRLQYLDAMGLTAWVGRYQLPNALPTEACEWPEPVVAEPVAPQARLHALIEEAPQPTVSSPQAEPAPARAPGPSPAASARALLGMAPAEASVATAVQTREATGDESSSTASWGTPPAQATTETVVEAQVTPPADQPPLRFSVQLAALDGRWLVMLPGDEAPHLEGEALLKALWRAAGITPTTDLTFSHFRWPLLANLKASAPLDEAREGLRAFLNGPARRDWQPERVLIFGNREDCATLREVLGITSSSGDAETSSLLDIPVWQGPELVTLARSSDAKRQLWPLLIRWGKAWSRGMTEGTSS
ncbi:hypothetical protein [Cobetia marina]|uniref:hypothetical protein n=1 Tax=Cobetia marina TaxID=28258 RepID=UPI00174D1048